MTASGCFHIGNNSGGLVGEYFARPVDENTDLEREGSYSSDWNVLLTFNCYANLLYNGIGILIGFLIVMQPVTDPSMVGIHYSFGMFIPWYFVTGFVHYGVLKRRRWAEFPAWILALMGLISPFSFLLSIWFFVAFTKANRSFKK